MTTAVSERDQVAAIEPRLAARRAALRRQGSRRRLRRLLVLGLVTVVVVGAVALLHSPWFSARSLKVLGVRGRLVHQVVSASGLSGHPPLISVNPSAVAARVEALPVVGTVEVTRHWPDAVTLRVTRRRPVGVVGRPGGGYAVVDGRGRVLRVVTTVPRGLVLLGVPSVPSVPGSFLDRRAAPVLEAAAGLPKALSDLVVAVGETKAGVQLDLISPVTVLLGSSAELRAKYEAAASVLAAASFAPGDRLDVSVPSAPVITGPSAS